MTCQPGILDAVPRLARYLSFRLAADSAPDELGTTLRTLAGSVDGRQIVVGIGPATVAAVDGEREFHPHHEDDSAEEYSE